MTALKLHRVHHYRFSGGTLPYLLYEPPGWAEEPRPFVLFLHGAGERGSDAARVATHGIPREIEHGRNFPFVAVSPQCPHASAWVDLCDPLLAMMEELIEDLELDPRRIYLTGISMGGFGAWKLAAAKPSRFAALVPICGGGDPTWAPRLRDLPTWVFHGADDPIVSVRHSAIMVEALQELGAPVRFTVYPGVGHDSWTQTYEKAELYDWLLGQRRTHELDHTSPGMREHPP